ncbi:MAG: hypothetical protein OSB21_02045 [Myxococcota bacterium]|nr:hypothetical protein [Myxococcota bacterium]
MVYPFEEPVVIGDAASFQAPCAWFAFMDAIQVALVLLEQAALAMG